MNKYLLSAAAALLLTTSAATAQQKQKPDKVKDKTDKVDKQKDKTLGEYDEIIIKRKDLDADGKVTIEIKDGEVLADGKPIEDYENDDLAIIQRSPNRFKFVGPASPFRSENGNWQYQGGDVFNNGSGAFLGIMTEGSTDGARIVNVSENSAAAKAGLQKGDVITSINDKKVFDHEQVTEIITNLKPDDKVTIEYKRNGKENTTTATLGARESMRNFPGAPNMPDMKNMPNMPPMTFDFDQNGQGQGRIFNYRNNKPRLGIKVQDTEDGRGAKVVDVDENSAAAKAGIEEDDVITSFDGKEVNSAEELARASRESNDKSSMKVELKRNGKTRNIEVKVPKKLKTAEL